jgi:hypothetical protein
MNLSTLQSVTTASEMQTWLAQNCLTPINPVMTGTDLGTILQKIISVNALTIDSSPEQNSTNAVQSGGTKTYVDESVAKAQQRIFIGNDLFSPDGGWMLNDLWLRLTTAINSDGQSFSDIRQITSLPYWQNVLASSGYTGPATPNITYFTYDAAEDPMQNPGIPQNPAVNDVVQGKGYVSPNTSDIVSYYYAVYTSNSAWANYYFNASDVIQLPGELSAFTYDGHSVAIDVHGVPFFYNPAGYKSLGHAENLSNSDLALENERTIDLAGHGFTIKGLDNGQTFRITNSDESLEVFKVYYNLQDYGGLPVRISTALTAPNEDFYVMKVDSVGGLTPVLANTKILRGSVNTGWGLAIYNIPNNHNTYNIDPWIEASGNRSAFILLDDPTGTNVHPIENTAIPPFVQLSVNRSFPGITITLFGIGSFAPGGIWKVKCCYDYGNTNASADAHALPNIYLTGSDSPVSSFTVSPGEMIQLFFDGTYYRQVTLGGGSGGGGSTAGNRIFTSEPNGGWQVGDIFLLISSNTNLLQSIQQVIDATDPNNPGFSILANLSGYSLFYNNTNNTSAGVDTSSTDINGNSSVQLYINDGNANKSRNINFTEAGLLYYANDDQTVLADNFNLLPQIVSISGSPTSSVLPNNFYGVFKDTTTGTLKLFANDGGVMKSVELT